MDDVAVHRDGVASGVVTQVDLVAYKRRIKILFFSQTTKDRSLLLSRCRAIII